MIHALIPHSIHSDVKPYDRQKVRVRLDGDSIVWCVFIDGKFYRADAEYTHKKWEQPHISHWYESVSKEYIRVVVSDGSHTHYTESQY